MEARELRRLLLVVLAALAWRVVHVYVEPDTLHEVNLSEYEVLAGHVADEHVLSYDGKTPSAFRLPVYPLTVAASYELFRTRSRAPMVALHFLLTALTLALLYDAGRRLLSPAWALAAALAAGLNPELAQLDWMSGPEPLFMLEFTAAGWLAVRVLEEPERTGRWLACGLVLGLSLLTRSTLLVWPPILAALLAWRTGAWRRAALLAASAYLCVVPWVLRNKAQLGRVVPFEDGMGLHMLWQGSTSVEGIQPDDKLPEPLKTYFANKDPRIGPASKELALANIREHPWRYAGFCVKRLPVLWFRGAWAERGLGFVEGFGVYVRRGDYLRAGSKAALKLLELGFLVFALAGLTAAAREPEGLVLGLQLLYMNIHVFTMGLPRYVAPAFPLVALFAAVGASRLASSRRNWLDWRDP